MADYGRQRGGDEGTLPLSHLARRKQIFFACNCCRQIWNLIPEQSKIAVEAAEKYADGLISKEEMVTVYNASCRTPIRTARNAAAVSSAWAAAATALWDAPWSAAALTVTHVRRLSNVPELQIFNDLHNPTEYRPTQAVLAYDSCLALRLAQGIYEDRAFDRLPILADALEEAGCVDQNLLDHCRTERHYCGCWALDLILGKK